MTASLLAALLLLNSAQTGAAEPVLEAVASLQARSLQESGGPPANNDMRQFCEELGANPCLWTETSAVTPALTHERLTSAFSQACTAASGVFDDEKDLARFVDLIGARQPQETFMGVLMSDHTCRTGEKLSGARTITYDFGKVAGPIGAPPRRGLAAVVNPNRSSYEALTGIFAFNAETLALRVARGAEEAKEACEIERNRAVASGADTNRGLVVERRGPVALVQPAQGEAIWLKAAELQPLKGPRCGAAEVSR